MLKDINLGQYYPGDSKIHKYDPRLKILSVMFFIVQLFFVKNLYLFIPQIIFLTIVTLASGLKFKTVFKGLRPLRWIILITFVINLLFVGGTVLFSFLFITVTKESLVLATTTSTRIVLLVWGSSILTLTTSPIQLTDGIESLLKPMKVVGLPAHEISMMMTIALRFIPTLIEETDKIMKAQKARGADFESGNVINRAKNLVPLLVPLFISSFRRADELATAMESRCYNGGQGRTKLNKAVIKSSDILLFIISLIFYSAIIAASILMR